MDTLSKYRALIKQLLSKHAALARLAPTKERESHVIFDEEHDRYMLFRTGWWGKERTYAASLYVRLHDDKIWIEEDMTEEGLATDLVAAGVPKEHIVLGFHYPTMRPFTEFAVA